MKLFNDMKYIVIPAKAGIQRSASARQETNVVTLENHCLPYRLAIARAGFRLAAE